MNDVVQIRESGSLRVLEGVQRRLSEAAKASSAQDERPDVSFASLHKSSEEPLFSSSILSPQVPMLMVFVMVSLICFRL